MLTVVITEKGGEPRRMDFEQAEVTIGRVQGNDIILPKGNVSKRHSRIVLKDGKHIIVDLKSTNGTYVNGRKISSPLVIKPTDKIYIGDFILAVQEGEAQAAVSPPMTPGPASVRKVAPPPLKRPASDLESTREGDEADEASLKHRTTMHEDDEGDDDQDAMDPLSPVPVPPPATLPPSSARAGASDSPLLATPAPPSRPAPNIRPPTVVPREAPREPSGPVVTGGGARRTIPSVPVMDGAQLSHVDAGATSRPPPSAPVPALVGPPVAKPAVHRDGPKMVPRPPAALTPVPPMDRRPKPGEEPEGKTYALAGQVRARVESTLEARHVELGRLPQPQALERAQAAANEVVDQMAAEGAIPASMDRAALVKDVLAETVGWGPLDELLADPEVEQVLVNRVDQIFVEKGGRVVPARRSFSSEHALLGIARRIVGHKLGPDAPVGYGHLPDGSRVMAVAAPLAAHGVCLTIRKPRREAPTLESLTAQGLLNGPLAQLLSLALRARRNILVSGESDGGKALLLSALGAAASPERVVSIEALGELDPRGDHWVALEARPPHIPLRDGIGAALRMRPRLLIVGQLQGGEALDLVQALATGQRGTLIGLHAQSASDAIAQLELLMGTTGVSLPARVVRELVVAALQLVIQVRRFGDGTQRVVEVAEIDPERSSKEVQLTEIFRWESEGEQDGHARGHLAACGVMPKFCEALGKQGVEVDAKIFAESADA